MNAVSIERDGYTIIETTHHPRIDFLNIDTYRFEHVIRVYWADELGDAQDVFVGFGPTPEAAKAEAEADVAKWQDRMAQIDGWVAWMKGAAS